MNQFKPGDYVSSPLFRGIALVVIGNSHVEMESDFYCDHGPTDYESYCPFCNGEVEPPTIVCEAIYDCYMVGDDRVYRIDQDELTLLNDDDFCSECGQIGCNHSIVE